MNHIFISYSKKDIAFARYLRRLLQEAGFVVWMDEAKLVTSQKWWPTIEHNVMTCAAFIVIMSPNSLTSDWVERELLVAEGDGAHKKIFPVLLAGRPWSRLGNIQYADMTAGQEAKLPEGLLEGLSEIMGRYTGESAPPPLPDDPLIAAAPPELTAAFEKPGLVTARPPTRLPLRNTILGVLLIVVVMIGIGTIVTTHLSPTPTAVPDPSALPVVMVNTIPSRPSATAPILTPRRTVTLIPSSPTPKMTATELSVDGYATLYMRQTNTADAQSWTPTFTLTPTLSNGLLAATSLAGSHTAIANVTRTAFAIASYTYTPTITPTPSTTPTPSITPTPTPLSAGAKQSDAQAITQVFVPKGCFLMGSTNAQAQAAFTQAHQFDKNVQPTAYTIEEPQHNVCITHDFWLDETDVTNAAFDAFVNAGGYNNKSLWSADGNTWRQANNVTAPKNECATDANLPDVPRVCVNYYEAEAYAYWRGGRLPTEAEWEYAARGPSARIYPWGDTFDGSRLNYCDKNCSATWSDSSIDDGFVFRSPVRHFESGKSWVGAYDMAGNVWQWTADCFSATFYTSRPSPDNDPLNECSGTTVNNVARGGSWSNNQTFERAAYRDTFYLLSSRNSNVGFRILTESHPASR